MRGQPHRAAIHERQNDKHAEGGKEKSDAEKH
jgi:hypothetical protein